MTPSVSPATTFGAVILAAGASQRLGQPKQLLCVAGKPLLVRTMEATLAVPALWPVVVVVGAHAEQIRPWIAPYPVLLVENSAWAEGMASSLRLGLTTVEAFHRHPGAVLFTLCDQPNLSAAALEKVVAAFAQSPAAVASARYNGHLGAPAILGRAHFPSLHQLVGDEGARQLFARLPPDQIAAVDLPELAFDIDTPADLKRLRGAG